CRIEVLVGSGNFKPNYLFRAARRESLMHVIKLDHSLVASHFVFLIHRSTVYDILPIAVVQCYCRQPLPYILLVARMDIVCGADVNSNSCSCRRDRQRPMVCVPQLGLGASACAGTSGGLITG